MKILIIEDDMAITRVLIRLLQREHRVELAQTGRDGLNMALHGSYDVILLDLSLPDIAGLRVCEQLRQAHCATPIIILTGDASSTSKVKLLDAGADDYLTKPYDFSELSARLRVAVRHQSRMGITSKLAVGDLVLDTASRMVSRCGQAIVLRRKEFDLLEYLMHHAGSVVTRAALLEHLWDANDAMWTNIVDVHIKYLRDKIDRPFSYPLITTVHGLGYKLDAPNAVAAKKRGGEEHA